MRPRFAFTLLEVMLAAALMLLTLTILVEFLIPLLRYGAVGSARANLVQMASLASERLTVDLESAPVAGVTLPTAAQPGLLAIHGLAGVTDTGAQVWASQLVLYSWDSVSGNLTRRSWPPGLPGLTVTSDAPTLLTVSEMQSAWANPNGTERLLIQGLLTDFSLAPASVTTTQPLHLHFILQESGREAQTYTEERDIYLRAGG